MPLFGAAVTMPGRALPATLPHLQLHHGTSSQNVADADHLSPAGEEKAGKAFCEAQQLLTEVEKPSARAPCNPLCAKQRFHSRCPADNLEHHHARRIQAQLLGGHLLQKAKRHVAAQGRGSREGEANDTALRHERGDRRYAHKR